MSVRTPRRRRAGLALLLVAVVLASQVGAAGAARLISGRQVKDGTVAGRDLRNGSLTGLDVADRSLSPTDLAAELRGAPGPAGPPGSPGTTGMPGLAGVRDVQRVTALGPTVPPGSYSGVNVSCPPGMRALGGGYSTANAGASAEIQVSAPTNGGTGWVASYRNTGTVPQQGYAWAVCAYVL